MKQITISNLETSTAQEVFDFVANHLLTQNKESFDTDGYCAYKSYNGLSCAAGCLISDKEYHPCLEGTPWKMHVQEGIIPEAHAELIQELQNVHDGEDVWQWRGGLKNVAAKYNLNTDILYAK